MFAVGENTEKYFVRHIRLRSNATKEPFSQNKDNEKFQRRIDYLVQNTQKILASFGFAEGAQEHEAVPYMVTNKLFASGYKVAALPIITFSELQTLLDTPLASKES